MQCTVKINHDVTLQICSHLVSRLLLQDLLQVRSFLYALCRTVFAHARMPMLSDPFLADCHQQPVKYEYHVIWAVRMGKRHFPERGRIAISHSLSVYFHWIFLKLNFPIYTGRVIYSVHTHLNDYSISTAYNGFLTIKDFKQGHCT